MAQTLSELNSQYAQWAINDIITSGDRGSCDDNSKYSNSSTNKKLEPDKYANTKYFYDSYYIGDDNAYGMNDSEFKQTMVNCKRDENSNYSADKCINMATTLHAVRDGDQHFEMGTSSSVDDKLGFTSKGSAYGCAGDILSTNDECTKEQAELIEKHAECTAGQNSASAWASDAPCQANSCDKCIIDKVDGRSPAWFGEKTLMNVNEEFDSTAFHMSLEGCPFSTDRELSCEMDGDGGDDYPACGTGSDEGEEGLIKVCRRPLHQFENKHVSDCCLQITDDNTDEFKQCPKGYCKSKKKVKTMDENGNEVEVDKFVLSEKCNEHHLKHCTKEVFQSDSHDLKENCTHWAHIRPEEWNDIANEICNISTEDIDKLKSDDDDIKNEAKDNLNTLFSNPLCSEHIKNNLRTHIPKLNQLCEMTVTELDGDWIKTKLHNGLESICPCYYPKEYYDSLKQKLINETDDEAVKSRIAQSVKPECYHNECQRTLLYDTSGGNECPSLQICANKISQNVQVIGGEIQNSDFSESAHQECNFSNTQVFPENPIPNNTSPPSDSESPPSSSSTSSGSSKKKKDTDMSDTGADLTLVYGGIVAFIVFLIIIFMVVM